MCYEAWAANRPCQPHNDMSVLYAFASLVMEMSLNVDLAGLSFEQLSATDGPNFTEAIGHQGRCGSNETGEYEEFYNRAQFASGLIVYPILCVTGILGNTLSLIVLSHKDMATSTNIYLLGKLMHGWYVFLIVRLHP